MDEALWDNLDRLRKQRKWREKGVASRPAPPSTNAVARPSNTTPRSAPSNIITPPPPPPTSTAPAQSAPPKDAEMTDGETAEATKEAAREKVKGRIPKK